MLLTIELVPEMSWYSNMRKAMPKEDWDKLRKSIYAKYNHKCGICGATGMLHCHEIWEYDDKNYIQSLKGFIALCPMCHHVKHIGLAGILADEGKLNYEDVERHFMTINRCTEREMDDYISKAFTIWEERSNHLWTIDLGEYKVYQKYLEPV